MGVTVPVERPPPSMELQRTPMWSNSPSSLSNSSSKERLKSSRRSSRIPKVVKWLLPLHKVKRSMLHSKKKSRARKEERDIRDHTTLLPLTMLIYLTLMPSLQYPLVTPLRPHFDGTYYTKWKFLMKMHLILLNASVWMVVCAGIDFLDEDEEPHFEQLHHNTQASSVLLSSLEKDEFDRVNGLKKAKDIWDTLQRAHEDTKHVKKAKRQLIEGRLDRFVMLDDEDPQEMYNQLKKLVHKVRAYGLKRWGDWRVIDRMLRAYAIKDTIVIFLIQQDPTFKKMTPDDVLGKIINHEMLVKKAQHVKNLSKGIISSRK
jgi:hypothetical protein